MDVESGTSQASHVHMQVNTTSLILIDILYNSICSNTLGLYLLFSCYLFVVVAMLYMKHNVEDYVSPYYHTSTNNKVYEH